MAHKKRSPELIALAVKLYHELHSTQKVAKRLELGSSTTYRILKDAGVELPERHSEQIQQRKKSLQGEQSKQAAVDYAAGMPMRELKQKYNVGAWAIKTAVRDNGVSERKIGGRYRSYTADEKAEIKRLYTETGWSQGQIAAKFNSSQPMIGRLLTDMEVRARGRKAKREKHGSWNGGTTLIHGYVAVLIEREDPMSCMAHHTGYVLEHRLVMARALGRPLHEHETVHHVNGDKVDNRLSNLQLRFGRHGRGVLLKCRKCGCNDIEATELD
jgi:transposase